jgi:hypothetical protein
MITEPIQLKLRPFSQTDFGRLISWVSTPEMLGQWCAARIGPRGPQRIAQKAGSALAVGQCEFCVYHGAGTAPIGVYQHTADRQLGRKPLRLGVWLGRTRTENIGFARVAGGVAHHAFALKLGE